MALLRQSRLCNDQITVEERGGSTDSFEELNNMTLLIESKSCNPLNGKKASLTRFMNLI